MLNTCYFILLVTSYLFVYLLHAMAPMLAILHGPNACYTSWPHTSWPQCLLYFMAPYCMAPMLAILHGPNACYTSWPQCLLYFMAAILHGHHTTQCFAMQDKFRHIRKEAASRKALILSASTTTSNSPESPRHVIVGSDAGSTPDQIK